MCSINVEQNDGNVLEVCEKSNDHRRMVESTTTGQHSPQFSAGDYLKIRSMISVQLNPVGSLQELCAVRNYPFPDYTFYGENIQEPREKFKAICSISIHFTSGIGRTKKKAKKQAAYLMYKQIEKLSPNEFHRSINNACEYNDETCDGTFFYLGRESMTMLKTFFDLKGAPKTPHLQNKKKSSNEFKLMTATDTLKTILEKEQFSYKCIMIPLNNCDEVEVLMQIDTSPAVVISKSGKNYSDAQESVALAVLTYYKLQHDI